MRSLKHIGTIIWVLFLSIGFTYAQDSTLITLNIRENISPIHVFNKDFYTSPSLRSYEHRPSFTKVDAKYFYNKQDLFVKQEGSGQNGFRVDAQSFLKNTSETTLWGSASYVNEEITDLSYNETNDYDLVYPYVMADTVGGNLNSETYYFKGGIAKKAGSFEYGLQASFRGVQAYRDRDPRPLNLSSDIRLSLSVSTEIKNQYAISVDLNGQKYNQKSTLDFASELGAPLVFHDAGLGAYNNLLAGSRTASNYNGYEYGTRLNLIPTRADGLIAQLGFNKFYLEKLVTSIIFPIGEVDDNTFLGLVGYRKSLKHSSLLVKLSAIHKLRNGIEAKFNNRDSESSIQKVSEDVRYRNTRNQLRLEGMYGRKSDAFDFYVHGKLGYLEDDQDYISPDRALNYSNLMLGLNVTGIKPVNKTLLTAQIGATKLQNLDASYFWNDVNWESGIYEMLTSNYQYLTSSSFQVSGKLRVDYPFPNNLNFFVQAAGHYTSYMDNYQGKQFVVSTGFVF